MRQIVEAFILMAKSLHSIAHSQAIIAASQQGITPDQAAIIQKTTDGLNVASTRQFRRPVRITYPHSSIALLK